MKNLETTISENSGNQTEANNSKEFSNKKDYSPQNVLSCAKKAKILASQRENNNRTVNISLTSNKNKPPRTKYSEKDLDLLYEKFDKNKYISETDALKLALEIGVKPKSIFTWFKNRRTALKNRENNIIERNEIEKNIKTDIFSNIDIFKILNNNSKQPVNFS